MKIATKYITLFVFITLLSLSFVFANPADKILEARSNVNAWETNTAYQIDDLVAYQGKIYKTVQAHTSQSNWQPPNVPALFTLYSFQDLGEVPTFTQPTGAQDAYQTNDNVRYNGYIFKSTIDANVWTPDAYPQGWEQVAVDTGTTIANTTSVAFSDNTFYTSYSAIQGNLLQGDETFVSDILLTGLAEYQPENFTVSMYTGTDNITYSIYSYTNQTNPETLSTNRTQIRQNGTYLFDVVSQDGFITYQTDGFSTQIASIPNQVLEYNENVVLTISDYFSGFTESEVFVQLQSGWSFSGCESVLYGTCKLQFGVENNFPAYDIQHYSPLTETVIDITAQTIAYEDDIIIAVNDGSTFLSDSFTLTIEAVGDPSANTLEATNIQQTSATLNGQVTDLGGESSVDKGFEWREVGAGSWTDEPEATASGVVSYSDGLTGLTAGTDYEYRAYVDNGTRFYGNTVEFTTSASFSGTTGGLSSIIAYYPLNNLTDITGNYSLTDSTTSTFVTGIIGNGYDFSSGDTYLQSTTFTSVGDFTVNAWVNFDSTTGDNQIWSFDYDDTNSVVLFYDSSGSSNYRVWVDGTVYTTSISPTTSLDMITVSRSGSNLYFYKNGDSTDNFTGVSGDTTTGGFDIGFAPTRAKTGAGFEGVIDEVSVYSTALDIENIKFLYNSGTPDANQQYPFEGDTFPPVQTATVNNFVVDEGETVTIDFDDYVTNYTSYSVTYDDPDGGADIVLTGTQSDTSTNFTGSTNGLTNEFSITGINAMTPINVSFYFSNDDGELYINKTIEIVNVPVLPVQLSAVSDFIVEINSSVTKDLDTFFTNYTNYTIVWENPNAILPSDYVVEPGDPGTQFLTSADIGSTVSNTKFNVSLESGNIIRVTGITQYPPQDYTIQVCTVDGCLLDGALIDIEPIGALPPTQEASIAPIEIDINEEATINVGTFFDNYSDFYVQYVDPDTSTPVNLSSDTTNSKFSVDINQLFAGNSIVFTGIAQMSALNITISACNTNGCTDGTTTLTVTSTVITPPSELDEFLDDFGNQGSTTVRLIIGLFIICALMFAGWYYTNTVVFGLIGGLMGLIISVAVGLISIWLLLLIILIALIPIFYKILFGGGN